MEAQDGLHELFIDRVEDYAIFLLDPAGHVLTWNAGAERIKGYKADEIIGRDYALFYPPEERPKAAESFASRPRPVTSKGKAGGSARTAAASGGFFSLTALRDDDGHASRGS